MRILSGEEEEQALEYLVEASEMAKLATCEQASCGSVIVKDNKIIGSGFNSPPGNRESQRRCSCDQNSYHKRITDKTCCIHAEQRAIDDALKNNPYKLPGSRLYFTRIDENGNQKRSGKPYCTSCSKAALDKEIAEFVLHHKEGVCVYDTEEYNRLSYEYKK